MGAISSNDLKNGWVLDVDGDLVSVISFQHVKPGKGGAFVRTKLKKLGGGTMDRTFRAGEKLERVLTETKTMQMLYEDGDGVVFMDHETYEQVTVLKTDIGSFDLIPPSTEVQVLFIRESPYSAEPPATVELVVAQTEPGVKGDTVSNVTKPALLETGATVNVPLFVNEGDRIKVDTRSREYVSRA